MNQKNFKELQMEIINSPTTRKLLKSLEGYYYYYNWQSDQENKLHLYNCGHCSFGAGKRKNSSKGENGVWIGPFENVTIAESFLHLQLNIHITNKCKCINHVNKN